MPTPLPTDIGVALDMHGCPNRCRHCFLRGCENGRMGEADLRWAVEQFRTCVKAGEDRPAFGKLSVSSWTREPDYATDYERLHELEAELSDDGASRYELLSIWRLAREDRYAEWAKRVGPDTCQITFFGMKETQDWFVRREGAFRDSVRATERLLEVGMKPRWQFFMTKRIVPDLDGLMRLVDRLRLRERVAALGTEFVMFIHAPELVGEGRHIAPLSAALEDTRRVPRELVASTQKHFGREKIWTTEAETVARIAGAGEDCGPPWPYPPQPKLWFLVMPSWDVFTNMATTDPGWKLGNMKQEPLSEIVARFEHDRIPALQMNTPDTLRMLAKKHGDPNSDTVVNDIERYWFERYCEETYGG